MSHDMTPLLFDSFEVKIKMTEALKSINEFCGLNDKSNVVKDEYVIQTMRYLELLKELKKSGNKKQKVI